MFIIKIMKRKDSLIYIKASQSAYDNIQLDNRNIKSEVIHPLYYFQKSYFALPNCDSQ